MWCFWGLAVGIFGQQWLGGIGGVSILSQLFGTALAIITALAGGFLVYGLLKFCIGIRLSQEDEFMGADLSIHRISANSDDNIFNDQIKIAPTIGAFYIYKLNL